MKGKFNHWDIFLWSFIFMGVIWFIIAPRVEANIIQDREWFDFETEGGDLVWETTSSDKQLELGIFQTISNIMFTGFLGIGGIWFGKIYRKAKK